MEASVVAAKPEVELVTTVAQVRDVAHGKIVVEVIS